MANGESAQLLYQPCSRIHHRRTHEAARMLGAIPKRAFQNHEKLRGQDLAIVHLNRERAGSKNANVDSFLPVGGKSAYR